MTISKSNGAADQWKPFLTQFTGALTAPCTVTIPNVQRNSGRFQNLTTGGFAVTVTTGVGNSAIIPPGGSAQFDYLVDSAGDVILPPIATMGTPTNDNAIAGQVGESVTLSINNPVALATGLAGNIGSITLSPGDWQIYGNVQFNFGGVAGSAYFAWIGGSPTGPFPPNTNLGAFASLVLTQTLISSATVPVGQFRRPLATTQQFFLNVNATFGQTCTAIGFLGARRVR